MRAHFHLLLALGFLAAMQWCIYSTGAACPVCWWRWLATGRLP